MASIGSSTYHKIKQDIIFGRLQPGVKLKLNVLKQKYEASLSTLRETLNRLATEGFVSAEEQRGFFVMPVSTEDLVEIAKLRILLECHAVKESVANGDMEWEANLVAARHKLHQHEQKLLAGDLSQKELWKHYDGQFHLAMIQACNSQNLLALHSILYEKYLRYQNLVLTYRGEEAVDEHSEMFNAALARDADKASLTLELHIRRGLEHTLAAWQDLPFHTDNTNSTINRRA